MLAVTYNIQFSRGKDGRYDLARCVDSVAGADIIALQEVERHWQRTGMADQPALIGEMLPDHYWVYGPSFDVHVEGVPGGPKDKRRRQHGDMLLSRWPILSSRLVVLPKTHYGDRFNMSMGALDTVVDCPNGPLRVWSIHTGYLDPEERQLHLKALLAAQASGAAEQGAWCGPGVIQGDDWSNGGEAPPPMPESTIWLGDFNMEPDTPEYRMLVGAPGSDTAFVDAWRYAADVEGEGITHWDALFDGVKKPRRIDYGFVTQDLAPRLARSWVDQEADGSDHQPVWVELGP